MTPELDRIEVPGAAEAEERAPASSPPRSPSRCRGTARDGPPGRSRPSRWPSPSSQPCSARRAARSSTTCVAPSASTTPAPRSSRCRLPGGSSSPPAAARGSRTRDGSRRLLGTYDDASWSPFGRYVVASAPERARRRSTPRAPSAGRSRDPASGSRAGRAAPPTRASPTSAATGSTSSRATARATSWPATHPQPAFHPRGARASGSSSPTPTPTGASMRSSPRRAARSGAATPPGAPQSLEWSSDGRRLLVLSPGRVSILDGGTRAPRRRRGGARRDRRGVPAGTRRRTPSSTARRPGSRVTLGGRTLFSLGGELRGLTWSPDGRWLLVGSPASDQWVFIRADGAQDRRGVEHLRPVPLAGVPRGRGLVLRET